MKREYLKKSWISPKVEVRNSASHGLGLFSKEPIQEGEVVVIWGGDFTNEANALKAKGEGKAIQQIDTDLWDVFDPETRHEDPSYNHNHSCDPNTWMNDEVTISARRDMHKDEELTIDYALFVLDGNYTMPGGCTCDSPLCRKVVTGKDWRRRNLQEIYRGHFSPYLSRKISNEEWTKELL